MSETVPIAANPVPEPGPRDFEWLVEEPDKHGDLYDLLLIVAVLALVVLSVGAALFFIDSVWDLVGLGEGTPPREP